VRINTFSTGSSAPQTISRTSQQVQTGGFGDPNGIPAKTTQTRAVNIAQAGVAIQRAIDHVSQKSIYFHDPDRNLLEIVWERPDALEIFARGRGDEDKPLTFSH